MNAVRLSAVMIFLCVLLSGCQWLDRTAPSDGTGRMDGEGDLISGEEALRLYGLTPDGEAMVSTTTADPEPWFPRDVWVAASVLPYDDPAPILSLPVYADAELGVFSTWVGDLPAGSAVTLLSVHADGRACFVEGQTMQGWDVRGWVACNRLLLENPGETMNVEGDGN